MVSALSLLADRLTKNDLLRHISFLAIALLTIWISGYHFGTFDQVIHIPFLKKLADPSLYPTDPFLDLRREHYSFFWLMFIPAYRAGLLEPVMFAVHVMSTYGLVWMFWKLTDTLFHNNLANLLSVLMLVFPHMGMPGFQIVEFSLLNRTFVLSFILGAIILYLGRRYVSAFLLLGIMFNLHVIYVGFAMTMILFDLFLRLPEVGWNNLLKGVALFIIGALPVLLWRSGSTPIDLQVRPDVLKLISSALLAGVYYLFLPSPQILIGTLHGIATLVFFLFGRRLGLSTHDRTMTNFVWAIGAVLAIQIITTYWFPITFILQLQILRIGVFLLIFGYIYFAGYLASRLQQSSLSGLSGRLVTISFIAYPSPLLPILFLVLNRWLGQYRWRQWISTIIFILISIATISGALVSGIWSPGFYLFEPKTPWTQTQDWARNNTPRDAMFITPPEILSHYIPDWCTFSERGTLATLVEIFEFPHPDYFPSWQERFEALAPGAINQFNGNYFDTFTFTKEAFYSLKPEDYLRIAQKYQASYLVIEKPHLQPFPVVYENEGFAVYNLQNLISLKDQYPFSMLTGPP
ncbi:MAG: hypothetical protein HZB50_07355 [Chloroflexi bacterium]|nr:hypothetical protein [Chloroflexota bacterium]